MGPQNARVAVWALLEQLAVTLLIRTLRHQTARWLRVKPPPGTQADEAAAPTPPAIAAATGEGVGVAEVGGVGAEVGGVGEKVEGVGAEVGGVGEEEEGMGSGDLGGGAGSGEEVLVVVGGEGEEGEAEGEEGEVEGEGEGEGDEGGEDAEGGEESEGEGEEGEEGEGDEGDAGDDGEEGEDGEDGEEGEEGEGEEGEGEEGSEGVGESPGEPLGLLPVPGSGEDATGRPTGFSLGGWWGGKVARQGEGMKRADNRWGCCHCLGLEMTPQAGLQASP
ncbi:unnamed protein product [Closterium sp. Naga37s-1]|nr:unnamed protein product [Closterium sp. Naga37s-1]